MTTFRVTRGSRIFEEGTPHFSSYTARALELQTGISKTQINISLKHCTQIGLVKADRKSGVPRANTKALLSSSFTV